MRLGTILMLAVALVCASGAAFLAYLGMKPGKPDASIIVREAATQKIVVAARDLKPGERLSPELLREADRPAQSLPKGAFLSKDALLKGGEHRVLDAIAENEAILPSKVSGFGSAGPLASVLDDGMRAVTIKVGEDTGVGGFAQPGDRVDVLLTQSNLRSETGAPKEASTATLVQNARVLATDQQTQRKDKPTPPKAVTLEVTAEDAQKLVLGGTVGQLSLTLNRSGGGRFDRVTGVIQLSDLVEAGPSAMPSKTMPSAPVVGVTRSVERKEYRVLPEEEGAVRLR
jgi:pilus assembly protein CpaB